MRVCARACAFVFVRCLLKRAQGVNSGPSRLVAVCLSALSQETSAIVWEPRVIKPKFRFGHCCGATLLVVGRSSVYRGKEKFVFFFLGTAETFFYRVDEVRIPVIFAFFCDASSVVAALASALGSRSVT